MNSKYIIKIPLNVSIYYCSFNKLLIISGKYGLKSIKLLTKINIHKQKYLQLTNNLFTKISNKKKKRLKSYLGTLKSKIAQIILNVSLLHCKKLKFIGIGYKTFLLKFKQTEILHFRLGYSHNIYFKIPKKITIFCLKSTKIFIFGNSYDYICQIAAVIRALKIPEPYKGKGILYHNEKINLKEGKKI